MQVDLPSKLVTLSLDFPHLPWARSPACPPDNYILSSGARLPVCARPIAMQTPQPITMQLQISRLQLVATWPAFREFEIGWIDLH